jgi:hypothetical protein
MIGYSERFIVDFSIVFLSLSGIPRYIIQKVGRLL